MTKQDSTFAKSSAVREDGTRSKRFQGFGKRTLPVVAALSALSVGALGVHRAYAQAGEFPSTVPFTVSVHVQDLGDLFFGADQFAGTRDQDRRLEQLAVIPGANFPTCLTVRYMAHIQDFGDTDFVQAPTVLGTAGQQQSIEGVAFLLEETCAGNFTVEYICHLEDLGDSALHQNGQFCGTRDQNRRLEGFQLTIRQL